VEALVKVFAIRAFFLDLSFLNAFSYTYIYSNKNFLKIQQYCLYNGENNGGFRFTHTFN